MITYEEALAKARQRKPNIDGCDEWENGWVFSFSGDAGYNGGLGRGPVVIRKSDGQLMNMPEFVYQGAGEYLWGFDV